MTVGSSIHALTYVFNEAVMTRGEEKVSIRVNCSVQGMVACFFYLLWQLLYTQRNFATLIWEPMQHSHTNILGAALLLISLSVTNLIHALSYFHTLKYFPMGAVSAGVMKGLQAVLVFVVTSLVFCGRTGGSEMCFNHTKLMSLIIVVGGVLLYTKATEREVDESDYENLGGYRRVAAANTANV